MVDQRNELIVRVVGLEAEHPLAQAVIPAQRLRAGFRRRDEVLDDRRGYVVAMQRRIERAGELPRLRDEPVALQDAVVDGRVCVGVGRKRAVERFERRRAIRLVPVGLQQRVVLAVGQRHLPAVVQRDDGMFDVGVREHRVNVVRHVAEPARQRQQQLALFVEHVFLLVVRTLDRESVRRQFRVAMHPGPHGRERDAKEFRGEPRARFRGFCKKDLHLLPPRIRGVVTLVLVVVQPRVVPDPVGELAKIVAESKSLQQPLRALLQACRAARRTRTTSARILRGLPPTRPSWDRCPTDSR